MMNVTEAVTTELTNTVRTAVKKMLDDLGWPQDYRYDRLMVDVTERLLLSRI